MTNENTADLRTFAQQLHGWGANVTAIKSGTKRPAHYWDQWRTEGQTSDELETLPWAEGRRLHVTINAAGDDRRKA